MAKHGDRTGSARYTRDVDFSCKRIGEIGAIIHMSTSHESANEEECDARGSTESIEVQSNGRARRISKIRARIREIGNDRLARLSADPRGRLKDVFHSIAVVEDAPHRDANDARRDEGGSLEIASYG